MILSAATLMNAQTAKGTIKLSPRATVVDGHLVFTIPLDRLIEAAQPSKSGKSDGVMLDLQSQFEYATVIDGRQAIVRGKTSAGQMGSTWFGVKVTGAEYIGETEHIAAA